MLGADVDAMAIPELLWRAGHQLVDGEDVAANEVGNPTGRVTGPSSFLHGDDLQVGTTASGLGGRAHAGRVTADHDQAFGHRGQPKPRLTRRREPTSRPVCDDGSMAVQIECRHYL